MDQDSEQRGERRVQWVIAGFAVVILACIVLSIHLSTLDVSFGTFVHGETQPLRDKSASYRVFSYDPRAGFVSPIVADAVLVDGTREYLEMQAGGEEFVEMNIPVPADVGDDAKFVLRVETPDGDDKFEVPLRPRDTWRPLQGSFAAHTQALAEDEKTTTPPGYGIALYPERGDLVNGFENAIIGRITKDNNGAAIALEGRTPVWSGSTTAEGFFSFNFLPTIPPRPIRFAIANEQGAFQIPLEPRPVQLRLRTTPTLWARPGHDIRVEVDTLPFRDWVHIDCWLEGTLLTGDSFVPERNRVATSCAVPEDAQGFFRITAYRRLSAPEGSASTALLWVGEPDVEKIAARVQTLGGDEPLLQVPIPSAPEARETHLEALFSRFVPHALGAPEIHSTLMARTGLVAERRSALRGRIHGFLLVAAGGGLVFLLVWLWRHHLRVRAQLREVLEDGIAQGDDIDADSLANITRSGSLYDFAIVVGGLLLTLYGLYVLLDTIRWEWF